MIFYPIAVDPWSQKCHELAHVTARLYVLFYWTCL